MNYPLNGIITHPSPCTVAETTDRLEVILRAQNIKIFARVDQRAEAEQVGRQMPPTELLIFGNPKGGTPIMVAAPLSAIDLPLKTLAWQDTDGNNWLSYNDPQYLKARFSLSDDILTPISGVEALIPASTHLNRTSVTSSRCGPQSRHTPPLSPDASGAGPRDAHTAGPR